MVGSEAWQIWKCSPTVPSRRPYLDLLPHRVSRPSDDDDSQLRLTVRSSDRAGGGAGPHHNVVASPRRRGTSLGAVKMLRQPSVLSHVESHVSVYSRVVGVTTDTPCTHHSHQGEALVVPRVLGHQGPATVSLTSVPASLLMSGTDLTVSDEV